MKLHQKYYSNLEIIFKMEKTSKLRVKVIIILLRLCWGENKLNKIAKFNSSICIFYHIASMYKSNKTPLKRKIA